MPSKKNQSRIEKKKEMIYSLKEFLDNIIVESLHPELEDIVVNSRTKPGTSKLTLLAKKIKDLTARGENTGIEKNKNGKENMPKGSSRAYLPLKDPEHITLDGKPTAVKTGMKVAIRAALDRSHDHKKYGNMSLGQLQNEAEGGDHFVNSNYRVITKDHHTNEYKSNTESGIFPPLIDQDRDGHEWLHVVHIDKITPKKFRDLTKTESHPGGLYHSQFCEALEREWNKDHGKHWSRGPESEKRIDHALSHPLVQKFLDHQRNLDSPPHDYRQLGNLGIFTHPHTGKQNIVARDHGFSRNVMEAYHEARSQARKKYK
jgi:hypothetical protein